MKSRKEVDWKEFGLDASRLVINVALVMVIGYYGPDCMFLNRDWRLIVSIRMILALALVVWQYAALMIAARLEDARLEDEQDNSTS